MTVQQETRQDRTRGQKGGALQKIRLSHQDGVSCHHCAREQPHRTPATFQQLGGQSGCDNAPGKGAR